MSRLNTGTWVKPCQRFLLVMLGCLFAIAGPVIAQQADFERATALLDKGEYPAAIAILDSIETAGYRSGALYINAGVAYSGINEQGMAKYYFLKAQLFEETEDAAAASLRYLEERFTHRSAILPELPWQRLLNFLSGIFGTNGLFWVALLFLYFASAGWAGYWFLQTHWIRYVSFASAGVMFVCLLLAVAIYGQYQRYDTGVMTGNQADVYAGPSRDSEQISTAYKGYVMQIDWATSNDLAVGNDLVTGNDLATGIDSATGNDSATGLEQKVDEEQGGNVEQGSIVEQGGNMEQGDHKQESGKWAYVRLQNGQQGWISVEELVWFDPLDIR